METYDPHKSTTEVRQGSRRLMNFRVLVLSLIGIVAAFGILFAISTVIQPGGTSTVTPPRGAASDIGQSCRRPDYQTHACQLIANES